MIDSLRALKTLVDASDTPVVDLEFLDDGAAAIEAVLGADLGDTFELLARHGSGSLVAVWHIEDGRTPVVWLDRDGAPNGVIATDVDRFVAVLPYDVGAFYDVLSAQLDHATAPDDYPDPLASDWNWPWRFAAGKRSEYDVARLEDWLKTRNIPMDPDPTRSIVEALKAHPRLDHWLTYKGVRDPHVA